jgi:hypothetical protein
MTRILAGCVAAIALSAQAADPVAFVADLKGNATIEGNGKLSFLAELTPGTKLLLGSGAMVSVTYASTGAEFTLAGPGEFSVTATEVRVEKGAVPARRNVTVLPDAGVVARVARTATASIRMRGLSTEGPAKSALEYPVNSRIATLQPTLRWQAGGTSGDVTVTVVDAKGREVWKGSAQPASVRTGKLSPATVYTWTVMTPKGVLGEARFETLPADAMAKAEKSRASARTFTDRVMHAFLLQDVGATQDAREAWAALARERPDLPELAVLAR